MSKCQIQLIFEDDTELTPEQIRRLEDAVATAALTFSQSTFLCEVVPSEDNPLFMGKSDIVRRVARQMGMPVLDIPVVRFK